LFYHKGGRTFEGPEGLDLFLFVKLLCAHLIADYVLQFDELYRLKKRHISGYFFHILILVFVMAVLTLPYLRYPAMWIFLALAAVTHFGQDVSKSRLEAKLPGQAFLWYLLDQAVHIAILYVVVFLPFSETRLTVPAMPFLDPLYTSNDFVYWAAAFILVTYVGTYTLHNFRRNYFADTREDHYLTRFEIMHALTERVVIAEAFIFSGHWAVIAASLLIGLLRLGSPLLRNWPDFALSFLWAAGWGLAIG